MKTKGLYLAVFQIGTCLMSEHHFGEYLVGGGLAALTKCKSMCMGR